MSKTAEKAPLEAFVKQTLSDIVNALSDFEAEHAERGFSAFPSLSGGSGDVAALNLLKAKIHSHSDSENGEPDPMPTIMPIQFDVAVETTTKKEKTGGVETAASVAIQVVSATLGGRFSFLKADENKEANRISFTVPIKLPLKDLKD